MKKLQIIAFNTSCCFIKNGYIFLEQPYLKINTDVVAITNVKICLMTPLW